MRVPVSIVSGFLGAGKTSLLRHLLHLDHGLRLAVLVNDFGALDIDAELISGFHDNVLSLANGCICCTVQSDLIAQLGNLLDASAALPDAILIEASGVSDPGRIARTLGYPRLRERLHVDSIVTVVDPAQFAALDGDARQLARVQLEAADLVIVNKTDLCSAAQREQFVRDWLYPDARVFETEHARVPLELLLCGGDADHHHKAAQSESDSAIHTAFLGTWSWQSPQPLSAATLRAVVASLPNTIYRAKGFCFLAEYPEERCLLQLAGSRLELTRLDRWGERPAATRLVLIGRREAIHPADLQALFDREIGDRPRFS